MCVIDSTCVVYSELCCVSRVSLHRKIPNYDLAWCSELELSQHIVAIASAGGPIGVSVWMVRVCTACMPCVHVCGVCVCMCVCVERVVWHCDLPALSSPAITLDVRLSPPDSSGRLKVQPSVQIRTASGIQLGTAQVRWHAHTGEVGTPTRVRWAHPHG